MVFSRKSLNFHLLIDECERIGYKDIHPKLIEIARCTYII